MKRKKFLSLLLSAAMAFTLLTATAFAAAPAEEENDFFDFLLGKKYTYLYAALTWDEYWANETVYAAGNAAASAQLDSHEEHDLGAFDAVSRATVNHGLHRGSFASDDPDLIANEYAYPQEDTVSSSLRFLLVAAILVSFFAVAQTAGSH